MRALLLAAIALLSTPVFADSTLHHEIESIAAEAHGRVGVACSLPDVALDCNLNAHSRLPMQSVYKFPIAMATLDAVEKQKFALTTTVRFLPSDLISPDQHSPLSQKYPQANVDVPVAELLRLAVSESDGVASDILLRIVGGPKVVDAYVRNLGIRGIQIHDPEKTLGYFPKTQYRNYAEPVAMVALLRRLSDHSPLSPEHTALLFDLMTNTETGAHRLRALLPPGTPIAHKTGSSGRWRDNAPATNDVGLVTLPNGKRLAIAVFVSDSPASESIREGVIARIAQAIWNASTAKSH